ncbi:G5 domain-containing protein [Candidatus Nanosynbacter sp. TM7-074]|uniref:G5 domain-containing protein n=1 Tax=Candidatus Nanosynbacter sp. TM7-074 TaxID=3158573 RepID=A0AB39JDX9_9BACT
MNLRLQARYYSTKIMLTAGVILTLVGGLFFVNQALADTSKPVAKAGERLVNIYDRGVEKTIVTKARTVREALKLAKISIDERQDVVEPGLDSEMVAEKYNVNIFRARPITVVDGNKRLKITTAEQTPALIAKAAGLEVFTEDKTALGKGDNIVVDGADVVMKVERASVVNFVLYGKESVVRTHAKTVGELLKDKNITLQKDDTLSVDQSARIVPGMKIELWRNGKQTVTVEEDVKFQTEKVQDANRDLGYRDVKQAGENGKKNVTYEIEMKNGVEVSRKEIASVVTKESKKQIEIVGAKSSNTFSGSFSEALARLRSCEGSYTSNTGNGYYGAYQFDKRTWGKYGGYEVASDAPASVQDQKAWETYKARGWQPWPTCKIKMGLQDIYR